MEIRRRGISATLPPLKSGPDLDFGVNSAGEQITILRRKLVLLRQIIDLLQRDLLQRPPRIS
jgi:hypothetical protein